MAIFNREAIATAVWIPDAGGWFAGYTLILAFFYSLTPVMFRMTSAAFFNISLLTSDFWSGPYLPLSCPGKLIPTDTAG